MKLNQKVTYLQLIISLLVLPISILVMYFSFKFFLEKEIDNTLLADELRIVESIENGYVSHKVSPLMGYQIVDDSIPVSHKIINEEYFDEILNKNQTYRILYSIKKINGINYSIFIKHALVKNNHLIFVIIFTILTYVIFATLLYQGLFWNFQKKLWKPFFNSIEKLKEFSLGNENIPVFKTTDIHEFDALNEELSFMVSKVQSDFLSMKEYAENAAHETQTPLAIIRVELEELMQKELPQDVNKRLYKVYQSANRLSLLTEKLLLLTKIDNHEYNDLENLNITNLILQEIEDFQPLVEQKNIEITFQIVNGFQHNVDLYLIHILTNNLLLNAIRHNYRNGKIRIVSNHNFISIRNTFKGEINKKELFNRFYKSGNKENSLGLGLSIVQRIADISGLSINACVENDEIVFLLTKNILRNFKADT